MSGEVIRSRLRRAWLALALALSLAVAPVAATAHEFGHLFGAAAGTDKDRPGHAKSACEICTAFAGLGHAAAPVFHSESSVDAFAPAATPVAVVARSDAFDAYHQRAPPLPSPID